MKIFIVDDDPIFSKLLAAQLKHLGYDEVIMFENGLSCIQNLYLQPDIIFLDYMLGQDNGLHYLKQIKDFDPGIEVVFCTAYENLTIALEALKYGSLDYLLKTNMNQEEIQRILSSSQKK